MLSVHYTLLFYLYTALYYSTRYEVNPALVEGIEREGTGLVFTGRDEHGERMEIAELNRADHPFYFGEWGKGQDNGGMGIVK